VGLFGLLVVGWQYVQYATVFGDDPCRSRGFCDERAIALGRRDLSGWYLGFSTLTALGFVAILVRRSWQPGDAEGSGHACLAAARHAGLAGLLTFVWLGWLAAIRMPDGGSGSGSGAVDEVVRAGVRAAIGPMLADERLGRVVEIEAVGVSESLERRRRVTNLGIARAADRLQEAMMAGGLIPRRPTGLSSIVMVGGVTEAMVAQITSPGRQRPPAEDFLEEMARVIGRLLR
jgi:hypothetical protein